MKGGTGRIPSLPDNRNELYRVRTLPLSGSRGKERILRLLWHGDQGSHPFCVGFAGEGWARTTPSLHGTATLDAVGYYNGAQQYDEWPGVGYDGSSVHGLMKFLVAHPDTDVVSYRWARTTAEILSWLASKEASPVVLGIDWHSAMDDPDRDGIIRPEGSIDGGHCLLAIGYEIRPAGIFFLLHNSWGRGWGKDGRAWIKSDDLQLLLDAEGGEAAVATKYPRLPKGA